MTQAIKAALAELDTQNDDHWTADGSPRVDVVRELTNDDTITRKMIVDADPKFARVVVEAGTPTDIGEPDVPSDDAPEEDLYILEMPLGEVFSSEENLVAFQAEATAQCNDWHKEISRLQKGIDNLSVLSAKADTMLTRLKRGRRGSDTEVVRAFQKRQQQVRENRAKRAQAFIDQGIDKGMLASEITGKSQLDQALSQRKAAPGTTRPDPRMPIKK